jgi:hypothetical protein
MRRSLVLIPALFLIAAGCGTGEPPNLPVNATGAAKDSSAAGADMAMRIANFRYELGDGVEADKDKQDAYQFGATTLDDAKRVARAFGVTGDVHADDNGWTIGDAASVYVGKNGTFSVNGNSSVSSGVACAEPEGGSECPPTTTTTTPSNFPSADEARTIATSTLKEAGVDVEHMKVTVETAGVVHNVRFEPNVAGMTVQGYEHYVAVTLDKNVAYGSGFLGSPDSVGSYELATLQRAVDRLNDNHGGVGIMEAQADAGATDSVSPDIYPIDSEPTVVKLTGVTVGLMMTTDDADQSLWLTPAYVFTTDPDQGDVAAPAAADKYFPTTTTSVPGDDVKPPAGGSGGGSTEPAQPTGACASDDDGAFEQAEVCASPVPAKAGEPVTFTITAVDSDRGFSEGCSDGVTADYGDDNSGETKCMACSTDVPEGPGKLSRQRTHTYAAPGTYAAKFTIKSGADCGRAHPNDSSTTLTLSIRVG